jgi:predicted ATPase
MAQIWAGAQQSEAPALLAEFKDAFESYRNLGVRLCEPFFLGLLADVYLLAGETVEGLAAVEQALKATYQTGEKWFVAELYRLEGRLIGAGANEDSKRIVVSLRKGIEVATTQEANLFALRCAIDLARLGGSAELPPESQELLSEIYSRWPTGYDVPELAEAEAILAS